MPDFIVKSPAKILLFFDMCKSFIKNIHFFCDFLFAYRCVDVFILVSSFVDCSVNYGKYAVAVVWVGGVLLYFSWDFFRENAAIDFSKILLFVG